MSDQTNRQWILRRRPQGIIEEQDFELVERPLPSPKNGEILVRNLWLGMDPAQRAWLLEKSYINPVQIGDVMQGECVAEVVKSNDPSIQVGTLVNGLFGWQDYAVHPVSSEDPYRRIQMVPDHIPPQRILGAMGCPGLTGYVGMIEIGELKEGMNVLVSGAAGATGSMASQIARIKGAKKVVGIAGGPDKCRWLLDDAKLDGAIDYKSQDLSARLAEEFPEGVDLFFDNVGGPILEQVIPKMALHGTIVMCGSISGYNDSNPPPGPKTLSLATSYRLTLKGFMYFDHVETIEKGIGDLAQWIGEEQITVIEDIQTGLENAPKTLRRLFEGKNLGKQILKIS